MIIGITGGIGSGKSAIANKLKEKYGFSIYDTDREAKRIIAEDCEVKQAVISLLGDDVFEGNKYNTVIAAKKLFSDEELLKKMNAIVHPVVAKDIVRQESEKLLVESALLIQVPAIRNVCKLIIAVTAPIETRIERAIKRDNTTREQIEKRIAQQYSDSQMEKSADIVVYNDGSLTLDELAVYTYNQIIKFLKV